MKTFSRIAEVLQYVVALMWGTLAYAIIMGYITMSEVQSILACLIIAYCFIHRGMEINRMERDLDRLEDELSELTDFYDSKIKS